MASSPGSSTPSNNAPDPDSYAQAVNDGQASVALAGSFWSFAQPITKSVKESWATRQAHIQERARLQESLGPWYEILKHSGSGLLCKQPVLNADAFRAYMEEKDGVFRVHPPCRVTERLSLIHI